MLLRTLLTFTRAALAALLLGGAAAAAAAPLVLSQALAVMSAAPQFPETLAGQNVTLPDDWARSRPKYDGSVWYRVTFDAPADAQRGELMALYVERACSNLEVQLNGQRIYSGGRMQEPVTRNCHYPQLVTIPPALLKPQGNVIDLHVVGPAQQHVSARQRAAGLSELKLGLQSELAGEHASRLFWNITVVQVVTATLLVVGCFMLGLYGMNRNETYLLYFGGLLVSWALLSVRIWWQDAPLDTTVIETLTSCLFPVVAALAVQFLLSHAQLRSRPIETALAVQCVLMPLTLLLAGPNRLNVLANAWYAMLAIEVLAAVWLYLLVMWRVRRADFAPMLAILGGGCVLLLVEIAVQLQLLPAPRISLFHFAVPLFFLIIGSRLLQVFARALHAAEAGRSSLEDRIKEATAEMERNFSQLSELRVEQVTEKERKRIAADLHDDLGAKLLTIVHTSESERISTLAREALEEMRLSVRGLTGKPVRLADALADWRAETVSRLGQANIEADWRGPAEEIEHLLPARAYVQTTRILREAVSNIIKHSGASHCKVRSSVGERDFGLLVQDNGKGIPMELDGKLDRGHGMSSMKHRAKQLQGQCLVESGPGYGTVIRLTLPL
jgi:two-component system, NarL family, sensor histidine kinase UhpB